MCKNHSVQKGAEEGCACLCLMCREREKGANGLKEKKSRASGKHKLNIKQMQTTTVHHTGATGKMASYREQITYAQCP